LKVRVIFEESDLPPLGGGGGATPPKAEAKVPSRIRTMASIKEPTPEDEKLAKAAVDALVDTKEEDD
jgi:hypothetical protein